MPRNRQAVALCIALAIGALLRLVALGEAPLSPAEAGTAWTAHAISRGDEPPTLASPPTSALLLGSQALLFWAGGAGDALARLPAALAGTLAVGLAWLFRPRLGDSGAVALAWLLAVDPWAVVWARVADGAVLAATAALGATGCLLRAAAAPPARALRWRSAAAVAAGLLASAGPLAWDLLPPLLLAAVMLWRPADGLPVTAAARSDSDAARPVARRSDRRPGLPLPLVPFAAAALLASTTGLAQWHGPAAISASLTDWLGSWHAPSRDGLAVAAVPLLRRAAGWGAVPIALVTAGALVSWWRRRRRSPQDRGWRDASVLAAAAFWGGAVTLLRHDGSARWLTLSLPLLVAAAAAAAALLSRTGGPASHSATPSLRLRAGTAGAVAASLLVGVLALHRDREGTGLLARPTSRDTRLLAGDLQALLQARGAGDFAKRIEDVFELEETD